MITHPPVGELRLVLTITAGIKEEKGGLDMAQHFICFILLIKSGHNAYQTQRMENKLHIMKSY